MGWLGVWFGFEFVVVFGCMFTVTVGVWCLIDGCSCWCLFVIVIVGYYFVYCLLVAYWFGALHCECFWWLCGFALLGWLVYLGCVVFMFFIWYGICFDRFVFEVMLLVGCWFGFVWVCCDCYFDLNFAWLC